MSTKELAKRSELFPAFFDDFFRPWNDWGMGKSLTTPAVNIAENKNPIETPCAIAARILLPPRRFCTPAKSPCRYSE